MGHLGSSFLMDAFGKLMYASIALSAASIGVVYVALRIPMISPTIIQHDVRSAANLEEVIIIKNKTTLPIKIFIDLIYFIGRLFRRIWHVLTKSRGRTTTVIIWLSVLQICLSTLSGAEAGGLLQV